MQEADLPTCVPVEGPPKTAPVMELADMVTMLDDPVLEETLGPAAASKAREANVASMLRLLLSAVRGTSPGFSAVSVQGQLHELGKVRPPWSQFPREKDTEATYLQFNLQTLDGHIPKLFAELLQMQESSAAAFLQAAQRVGGTLGRTNLVLVGLAGAGARGHRDYAEACNYLMALVADGEEAPDLSKAYALWVFVRPNPAAINALKAWLLRHPHPFPKKKKQQQQAVGKEQPPPPQQPLQASRQCRQQQQAVQQQEQQQKGEKKKEAAEKQKKAELEALLKAGQGILQPGEQPPFGAQILDAPKEEGAFLTEGMVEQLRADPSMQEHIIVIEQRPGDLVRAPAGWIHFVTNVTGPSCKFAWDYYHADHLPHYITAYQVVFPHVGQAGGEDYMGVDTVLVGIADEYHIRCTLGPDAAAGM